MNILIAGSAGSIGYRLARQLMERGDNVVAFDVVNDDCAPTLKEAN